MMNEIYLRKNTGKVTNASLISSHDLLDEGTEPKKILDLMIGEK